MMNLNKIRSYIKEDVVWKILLDSIPEDTILFFDLEVMPPTEREVTPEHKIVAIGAGYRDKIYTKVDIEPEVLKWFNDFLADKEIYLTVGYGSLYLDIPLILLKLRKYKNFRNINRVFNKVPHLDIIYQTGLYLYASGKIDRVKLISLDEVAKILNLPKTEKFSINLYMDGKKMEKYLKKDVESIIRLFKLLKNEFFNYI